MAVSIDELHNNDFWMRKYCTITKIQDSNNDGLLSRADYKLVIQRYKEMGASEDHLKTLEKNYCKMWKAGGIEDDTTELTYEQFAANYRSMQDTISTKDVVSDMYETQFEIIDSDKNGEISFKEWTEFYTALGIDTKHARPSFDAMDTNGDGIVSKEEFAAYTIEFFLSTEDKLNSSIMYGPLSD